MRIHAMAVGLTLCGVAAAEEPGATQPAAPVEVPVYKADGVVIDGALDEPCWRDAAAIPIAWAWGKTGEKSDAPYGRAWLAWDGQYLYIAYETFDTNLIAVGKDQEKEPDQGPSGNRRRGCEIWSPDPAVKVDVAEFFISFNDPHFFWELHHNALNQFNDVWITVAEPGSPLAGSSLVYDRLIFANEPFIKDDGEATLAMAVKLKAADGRAASTVNDESDTDTGYTAELRLPWGGLGAPAEARADGLWKMAGRTLRVLSVIQNGDMEERYNHSSPTRKAGGFFHHSYDHWPAYRLEDAPAPEPMK